MTRRCEWCGGDPLGFTFVGSTICNAFMQAVGMVNDHTTTCYRHREVMALAQSTLADRAALTLLKV